MKFRTQNPWPPRTHARLAPTRLARTRASSRKGATSVEFALVVPIIFTMFLGAIEITRLNFLRHTAANAAYEGARAGIVPGGTVADSQNRASSLMRAVGAGESVNISVVNSSTTVSVTVTVPVDQNSWALGRFTHGLNISQTCQLRKESL